MNKNDNINLCSCNNVGVGYVWAIPQTMTEVYEPMQALENGTMFPELNMPLGSYGPEDCTGGNEK